MKTKKRNKTRREILLEEARAAEVRATYYDYYGRKTPEYFSEMRLARKFREMAEAA